MEPPHPKSSSAEELEFPEYAKTIFFCLPQRSKPRYWLLKLITWSWFEKITMSVILLNCITMGMQNPLEGDDCDSRKCLIVKYLDDAILVYFVFEMLVKIMAMGFVGKKTYLSQSWNILDFFIVVAGLRQILVYLFKIKIYLIILLLIIKAFRNCVRFERLGYNGDSYFQSTQAFESHQQSAK